MDVTQPLLEADEDLLRASLQCASGIAAFYHSIARFVGWMAQMDASPKVVEINAESRSAGQLSHEKLSKAEVATMKIVAARSCPSDRVQVSVSSSAESLCHEIRCLR